MNNMASKAIRSALTIASRIGQDLAQQKQADNDPNRIQQSMSGAGGLAESMAPTNPTTFTSGVSNPIADPNMFGNRTNGNGMFGMQYQNGLAAMANQQNPNINNNTMNGAKLI
jgi:hypothetical protein